MTWQLAITLSILAIVATNIIKRRYSQRSTVPATIPPAVSYLFGVAPLGIIVGLLLAHTVHWSWWLALLFLIEAVAMTIANWIGFKATRLLPVAPYQTISLSTNVLVIGLGWVVLGETLTNFQLLGALILLMSALLAIWAPIKSLDSIRRKIHRNAVTLTLIAAIATSIGLVTEKATLGHMDIGGALIFGWSFQTIGMLLLAAKDATLENFRKFTRYEFKWSAYMGIANGIGGVFYVIAIVKADNISLVTAVAAIGLPLMVLAAHIFLKERDNQKLMWIAIIIGFLGLLITGL